MYRPELSLAEKQVVSTSSVRPHSCMTPLSIRVFTTLMEQQTVPHKHDESNHA